MLKSVVLASALVGALAFGAASSAHATSMLQTGLDPRCGPGGCFANNAVTYQQTFASGVFDGASHITSLSLDRRLVGAMQDHVVKISFLAPDGTEVANWGGWLLAVAPGGDTAILQGPAFDWDPSQGALTLKIDLVLPGRGGAAGFAGPSPLDAESFTGRAAGGAPAEFMSDGPRAPTPTSGEVVSVPEPSTWAMMLVGFGGAGALLRRARRARRPVVCVQP